MKTAASFHDPGGSCPAAVGLGLDDFFARAGDNYRNLSLAG
jgi:hypothetical protein